MGKKKEAEKALKKARKRVRLAEELALQQASRGKEYIKVPYPPLAMDTHFSSSETEADCRNGVHCIDVEHSCAIDLDHEDHPWYCCSCKVRMNSRFGLEDEVVETMIFQALGAASMCWERIDRAGIFESERCAEIGDELMKELGIVSTRPKHESPVRPTMKVAEELGPKLADNG